jgi:LemA protein
MLALAGQRPRIWSRALIVAAAGILLAGCGINTIPTLQERAKAAWSEVLNQYQRRADLIPNLVETVKGYASQESKVLTEVVEARAKATQVQLPPDILTNPDAFKKFQEAQGQLSGALARLLAVVENYPDLKSNQNFLRLQDELAGTENRIATERRRYNESVRSINATIRTFPVNLYAGALGFEKRDFFEAAEGAEQVPQVDFTDEGEDKG